MQNNNYNHNPDVLTCLANLSNDEVFTPPEIAEQMLDMLPQELFTNKNTTFLDPCCKSGVFLREIAKRLIKGLESEIPDLQERLNHIYTKQLFGIGITELTSLISCRTLYCSKTANGEHSVCTTFNSEVGNIHFERIEHTWANKRCKYCGASKSEYNRDSSLETHAYQFIHHKEVFKMKFDVIVGNPPYQLSDGGHGASARPIYHYFVTQAKKLNPRFMTMIIPARWFSGGKGLDSFRHEMLHDRRIRILHDYFNATDCFSGIDLSGGVCYFLWNRDAQGQCEIVSHINGKESSLVRPLIDKNNRAFIRFNQAINIINKVAVCSENSLATRLSVQNPYGIATNFQDFALDGVKLYAYPKDGYIRLDQIPKNKDWINKYKVCISNAYGERGNFPYLVLGKPFISEPNSCSTATYMVMSVFDSVDECKHFISYVNTKFFRFLVLLKKSTQHASREVYSFVPVQDFSEPWTDEKLYKKYGLTQEEIDFIESMIKPME